MRVLQKVTTTAGGWFISVYHTLCCGDDETKVFDGRYLYLRCVNCGWQSAGMDLGGEKCD